MNIDDVMNQTMQILILGSSVEAIKYYRNETNCSLKEAKEFVELLPSGRKPLCNTLCPHCDKPLRTDLAKQCFECGKDWH